MLKRITYTCRKCNWKDTIIEQWADLKPKRCGNKSCMQGFQKDPSWLIIELPAAPVEPTPAPVAARPTQPRKAKEEANGQG